MNKIVKRIIYIISSGVILGLVVFGIVGYFNGKDVPNNSSQSKYVQIECDYPYYDSIEKMIDSSTVIANGVVVNDYGVTLMNVGAGNMEYRTYDIKVTECIKGNAEKGDIIPVKILATDDSKYLLKENNEYIYFLVTYDNNIPASLINIDQSVFYIEENNIVLNDVQKYVLEKCKELNDNIVSFKSQNISNTLSKDSFKDIILDYLD